MTNDEWVGGDGVIMSASAGLGEPTVGSAVDNRLTCDLSHSPFVIRHSSFVIP
jgi:hypothetical protein